MPFTRRTFCAAAAALTLSPRVLTQGSSRLDVAAAEKPRVLAEAAAALQRSPRPITACATPQKNADPHNFFSEPEVAAPAPTPPFRAHADALIDAAMDIAALTAAYVLTKEDRYALHAGKHLFVWFVDPATRVSPAMTSVLSPAGIADLASLAEIARALPFLVDTAALYPPDFATARAWFAEFQQWLNSTRPALIAREAKDHSGSTWLLLSAAIARLLADEAALSACRLRFKRPTLRNQIAANGDFPHEVATPFPFRNTLFNFDLLAGACELLSTPFSSLWTIELEDGPGMRGTAAFVYPLIKETARWPYLADATHFRDVPLRRPGLLLAGRAYTRPEYVDLWRSLAAPARDNPVRATFPISQPLLWVSRAPHGA